MDITIFKNKRILVTGAGRGIGRDLAKILYKAGAVVYALSKTEENLKSLKQECPSINVIKCNLANWKETEDALKDVEPLDHLVNNAGIAIKETLFSITQESVDLLFDVNVKAVLNVTHLVTKKMVNANKRGSIVNVSSCGSQINVPMLLAYSMTKSALDKFTKCSAKELAQYKIRINSVNPTIVMTDMGKETWNDHLEEANKLIPMGRFAEVDDCINAILFLLSDLTPMTTGETFLVDGGAAL